MVSEYWVDFLGAQRVQELRRYRHQLENAARSLRALSRRAILLMTAPMEPARAPIIRKAQKATVGLADGGDAQRLGSAKVPKSPLT